MRTPIAASLALALLACSKKPTTPPPAPPTEATLNGEGFSVHVAASPFAIQVIDATGQVRLQTAGGPRATYNVPTYEAQIVPGWDGYRSNERPWVTATAGTLSSADAHSAHLAVTGAGASFDVSVEVDGPRVRIRQVVREADDFNKTALAFALRGDDHFFGMGERFATLDHRGQTLYSWAEEGATGGGEDGGPGPENPYPNGPSMTYFPVPFFHTTHGVAVHVATTFRSELHFGTDADAPDTWRVAVDAAELPLTLYVRDQPLQALADYTADTGRPPVPSPWAWGPRRRINQGNLVDGVEEYQAMRDRKLPITAIDDAMHALPHSSQTGREAQLQAWTALLHGKGYKVLDYNNPYVSATDSRATADYAYGTEHGYFELQPDGGPATTFFISGQPQRISAIDLTNPDAVAWFQSLLQRSLDLGYDGWMHDFGEYVARSSRFHDGRTGLAVHNAFPVLSVKAGYEFLQSKKPDDFSFLVRSGYAGTQAYAIEVWGGDAEADFDNTQGLPSALRGGLNLSLTGVPYWGTDMGGYKCLSDAPHDKEMLVRWYELGAVSPMMHDEDACANPINHQTKARLWDDQQTQDIYRAMAGLHTRLAPYFRALALEAHASGTPVTRHPFLVAPASPEAWAVEDSYFVGPALYAAPVVRRGVTTRHLWLPPGRYVELTERSVHAGPGYADVPAPLDRLPLFLAENQLVPLLDAEVQTLAPATDATVTEASRADVLDALVLLGPGGSATFTLADGTVLTATRLPADGGNPGGLADATEATVHDCARCGLADQSGQVHRVRLNGALAAQSAEQLGDVRVEAHGGPARRVRWEVLELP